MKSSVTLKQGLNLDATKKHKDGKTIENKNNVEESIITACENDSKKIYDERRNCELSLNDQKCDKCNFATHSKGVLKMHERDTHAAKLSFKDILYGFEVDEEFFKMLIETMYEGEKKDIPSVKCGKCSFNSYGEDIM